MAPRPPRRYFTNFLAYGYSVWDYDARAMVQGLWCMVHRCYGAKCMKRNDICQPRSLPVTPTSGHGHFRPPIAYSYGVWGYGAQAMVHRLWCMVHKCYGMLPATPTSGHAHRKGGVVFLSSPFILSVHFFFSLPDKLIRQDSHGHLQRIEKQLNSGSYTVT